MKKRNLLWIILGGATTVALSFLVGLIENEVAQAVHWCVFAFGLLLFIAGVVAFAVLLRKPDKRRLIPEGAEYEVKKCLMTSPEIELYHILLKILGRKYCVFPQMSLNAMLDKRSGGGFRSELFRIADFCITDLSYQPLLVIELNDSSHQREERRLRDEKVLAICANAGLPVLSIPLSMARDEKRIKNEVRRML